jgi:hypothetical protein
MSAPTERAAISRSGLGQARTRTVAAADRGLQYYSAAAGVDNVSMCLSSLSRGWHTRATLTAPREGSALFSRRRALIWSYDDTLCRTVYRY